MMNPAILMVHVDDSGAAEARITFARQLAERWNATLIGIAGAMPMPPLVDPFAAGAGVGDLAMMQRENSTAQLSVARTLFERVVTGTSVSTEWREAIGYPADWIASQARAADLVILGRDAAPSSPYHSVSPGDVLMKVGRPVLIVPPGAELPAFEHIVIGWKDTREAQRAVADALPWLAVARQVSIVAVQEKSEAERAGNSVRDVVEFLARHGISARPVVYQQAEANAAAAVLAFARDEGADLLVMGAYGRARLSEWIFGGVTRDVLLESGICCLASH
jgi:nucleotide-binding universal stress UspA family protein